MDQPQTTFVIPAYNPGEWLDLCLESLIVQTDPAWRAIVIDDGSTAWPDSLRFQDPRITLLRTPNRGVSAARNLGWRQAQTPYIVFLDADDLLEPDFLAKLLPPLQNDPQIDLAFCDGRLLWMYESPESHNVEMPFGPAQDFHANLKKRPMNLGAIVFRTASIAHAPGFDLALSSASEDWDFLLQATPGLQTTKVDAPLFVYRLLPGSMSRNYPRLYALTDNLLQRLAINDRPPNLAPYELKSARRHLRNWAVREARTQRQNGTDNGKTGKLLKAHPELWFWFLLRLIRR